MSNPSDRRRASTRRPPPTVVAVMLMAPLMAWLTVTPTNSAQARAIVMTSAKSDDHLQIRCWQHGRLLFERNHVSLDERQYALRVSGKDRNGRPLYVAEMQDALCLVETESAPPAAPPGAVR